MKSLEEYNYTPLSEPIPISEQDWPEGTIPLVCTETLAYNHEPFIRECLESILMQKTTFPVQVLVHEDCSTDNTAAILKEYQQRYPKLIKVYYQPENIHSLNDPDERIKRMSEFKHWQVGKYIALCEGDDYWTDPLKLQKQVGFLEKNDNYSLCVSGFKKYNVYTKDSEHVIVIPSWKTMKSSNGYTFTLKDTQNKWLTKTLTAVYRNYREVSDAMESYRYDRDVYLFYHLLKLGKGFYFTQVMGVYQIHHGGIQSMQPRKVIVENAYIVYKELYEKNKDDYSRRKYAMASIKLFNYSLCNSCNPINMKKNEVFRNSLSLINSFYEVVYFFLNFCHEFILRIKTMNEK